MDEEVHGFVKEYLPPLTEWEKTKQPFLPNGSEIGDWNENANAFNEKTHKHRHHKRRHPDVAERGMDEEVHGFVKEYTPPLKEWVRSEDPFVPNGSDPKAQDPSFAEHHKKHHKKDIGERGYDEEVHWFVHEAIPPLNTRLRSDDAFVPNGSEIGDWNENSLAQKFPDAINDAGMATEHVGPFVKDNLPPLTVHPNDNTAWVPNGSNPAAFESLAQSGWAGYNPYGPQHWAYETGMNPDQFPYDSNAISAMSDRPARLHDEPLPNGYMN